MSNKIELFETAMCCPTGLCGPSINPDLLRISTVASTLEKKGATVKRYNLKENTKEFITNKMINELLAKEGESVLPITIVDGKIEKKGEYPTNEEFTKWTGITIESAKPKRVIGCCGGGSRC